MATSFLLSLSSFSSSKVDCHLFLPTTPTVFEEEVDVEVVDVVVEKEMGGVFRWVVNNFQKLSRLEWFLCFKC